MTDRLTDDILGIAEDPMALGLTARMVAAFAVLSWPIPKGVCPAAIRGERKVKPLTLSISPADEVGRMGLLLAQAADELLPGRGKVG